MLSAEVNLVRRAFPLKNGWGGDPRNSSPHHTKAEFNNCFIFYPKCLQVVNNLYFLKNLAYFSVRFQDTDRCFLLADNDK